ncbi:hypothetical protein PAHAL_2G266700 [Panicum hallii]|jgi:hypothetical protein|uniref:Uncharacterized protein n=1 Tax=Panicum hallii TaxID=206008 RepID=A0A2T8KQJ2_9POAL|nr:hypothetical protein PAHAL_2G266700 [Panicum hallii]
MAHADMGSPKRIARDKATRARRVPSTSPAGLPTRRVPRMGVTSLFLPRPVHYPSVPAAHQEPPRQHQGSKTTKGRPRPPSRGVQIIERARTATAPPPPPPRRRGVPATGRALLVHRRPLEKTDGEHYCLAPAGDTHYFWSP